MAEAARTIDTIDVRARWVDRDVERLNARFVDASPAELLHAVLTERLAGHVAVVSSFGTESAVLLDLVAAVDADTPVLFLDTGKHFPETLAYREALSARLGLSDVRILTPRAESLAARDGEGIRWSYDPDGCCEMRKVAPLAAGLAGFDASITGRKAFQASTRAALPHFEIDDAGALKINPLARWTRAEILAHFAARDLPRHPLEASGYASIGCATCTSIVKPGEDPRSGRWRGFDKTECGIHTPTH